LVLWLLAGWRSACASRGRRRRQVQAGVPAATGRCGRPTARTGHWPALISARNHDLIDLLSRLNAQLFRSMARLHSAASRNVAVNVLCLARRIPPALSSLTVSSAPTSTGQRISHSEHPSRNSAASCPVGPRSDGADAIGRSGQARAQCRQKRQGISRRHVPRGSFCLRPLSHVADASAPALRHGPFLSVITEAEPRVHSIPHRWRRISSVCSSP